tara:strand:- start:22019 stop:24979 length:2961 start_codon:yes stop_codon:yes gene_type:complete
MSTEVKFRRGSTVQHATFTGAQGEVTVDTDLNTIRIHDGATIGGHRVLLHSEFVGTGTGTVTQIDTGTGLTGGPITASGSIALTIDTQNTLTNAQTAYSWGNHASFNYLTSITAQPLTNLNDVITGATDGQILHWVSSASQWQPVDKPAGSSGGSGVSEFTLLTDTPSTFTGQQYKFLRVNTAEGALEFVENTGEENLGSNRGAGTGQVFYAKDGTTNALQFRSILGGTNITVSQTNDEITIDAAAIAYTAGTGLDLSNNVFSLESGYVKNTGDFTLAGDLTFAGSLIFQNTLQFGNTITINQPGTTDKEIFLRGKLADATDDFLELSNASTSTSSLAPALRGGVESNSAISPINIISEVAVTKDTGTTSMMEFTVRRGSDVTDYAYGTPAAVINRPLFTFTNQGNTRFKITATESEFLGDLTVGGNLTVPHNVLFKNSFSLKSGLESAIPAGTYPGCVGIANNELYFSATSNSGEWLRVAKSTEVPTGVFYKVTADTGGSKTATNVTEELIFAGGTNVDTILDASTNTITINSTGGGSSSGSTQDLWKTITSDAGSAIANSSEDALSILGGTGITTSMSADVLTISQDASNLFKTISVSGQTNIIASGVEDILTFVAGDNVTIATDSSAKTVTINSTASGGGGSSTNAFGTISVSGFADVVADQAPDVLTFVAGTGINISSDSSADEITITNSANASTAFTTIAVSGQSNVQSDTATDTLEFVAGSNITLTTDAINDKVTIAAAATSQDTYKNIAIAGQGTISAGDPADTLTMVAGTGINLVTSTINDSITITNSLPDTSDIQYNSKSFAARTFKVTTPTYDYVIEDITLDTATMKKIDGVTAAVSPTIYLMSGHTYCFDLDCNGHPFRIKTSTGEGITGATNDYNTGLRFWNSTSQQWFMEANAQGQVDNLVFWTVPQTISGDYVYQCGAHSNMNGVIKIVDITALFPFGAATTSAAGTAGLVPAPAAGDELKVLQGDAQWGTN